MDVEVGCGVEVDIGDGVPVGVGQGVDVAAGSIGGTSAGAEGGSGAGTQAAKIMALSTTSGNRRQPWKEPKNLPIDRVQSNCLLPPFALHVSVEEWCRTLHSDTKTVAYVAAICRIEVQ